MSVSNVSILIVDDKPDKVLSLEAVLDDLRQNVVRAYSGREALRHVLNHEFAVILLDVNMPGMDGFETAELIRKRRQSAHVPIIFLTAMSDEMHAARGYSLGAVDYILTPVVPEILRSKVAVFVDLFRKTQQVRSQAERLRHRASQLHQLTGASLAINSANSVQKIVEIATRTARDVIVTLRAGTIASPRNRPTHHARFGLHEDNDRNRTTSSRLEDHDVCKSVSQSNKPARLNRAELAALAFSMGESGRSLVGIQGILAAPLTDRDGNNMGLIQICNKVEGEFTEDDEAILVQLAQMASVAIENVIFAEEREANRLKDEFLSTLSHELRTPLNAIAGWIQLLKMGHNEEDLSRGLKVIDQNVKSQTKLIEDLLDLSRIASGKLRVQPRPCSLTQILQATLESLQPTLKGRELSLNSEFDEGEFTVRGDPERLGQVFTNLLGNAAKFTPAGGRLSVRMVRDGGVARCSVTDSGEGIDPEFLPHVFDRFRQADSSSSRRHGGLGIGLTIVQQIVALHGGTVSAQSEGKGRGATFTVVLPLEASQVEGSKPGASPANGDSALPSLRDIRILVVEDEPDARDVIAKLLGHREAQVWTAGSAAEAIRELSKSKPDVLVTDLAMPEQDGFELLKQLRKLPPGEGGDIPAIAVTAFARYKDRVEADAAGFRAHVVKPIDPKELVNAVLKCIQQPKSAPKDPSIDMPPSETETPDDDDAPIAAPAK